MDEDGPAYLGCCDFCGIPIYTDMEHYDIPDVGMYCSAECLLDDLDQYHIWGVTD